jgi:hypothetical protein
MFGERFMTDIWANIGRRAEEIHWESQRQGMDEDSTSVHSVQVI